ncbi:MAG: heavy metal translocating P-type ATPase [Candidatus Nealsonbacteria bacterium]|nr:heavy metal translocating P-type ATPase [Candidatus Nealsonbacteria bacterium]
MPEEKKHKGKHKHHEHHQEMVKDFRKRFFISLFLSLHILVLSPTIQNFFGFEFSFEGDKYILLNLSAVVFLFGGWPFLKGFAKEVKEGTPGMMTLIALAMSVAFFYSALVVFGFPGKVFFWELVSLIVVMLLGHWIEMRSVLGASKSLRSLAELVPSEAHLVTEEGTKDTPVSELKLGDVVLIRPGEKIPADGKVLEGQTSVNEALLTGESKPVAKKEGDEVIAGSINQQGSINVSVTKAGENSYISQVISLVEEAQASKSKTQQLADKAALWLTIVAIVVGTLTLLAWIFLGKEFAFALERMVTVMVITCPHALGLAIPLVVSLSTSLAATNGILIRNRRVLEKANKVQAVVFDKTGTLTKGEFGVTNIITEWGQGEDEVIFYAACLESRSEHPIGRAIVKKAEEMGLELVSPTEFEAMPGKGVRGKVEEGNVLVVGENYLEEKGAKIESKDIERLLRQGKTVVYVLIEDELVGAIALADVLRDEAKQTIQKLRKMGIKCQMVTGDEDKVASWTAKELGVDDFFAEVLPHKKPEIIHQLQRDGLTVAMVGDGVNDAPALAKADVGIAIGAGTDVAIESADIILVQNDLLDVPAIINLAKAHYSKMKQNLFWATAYNVVAIPLAAGVLYPWGIILSPAVGALMMSLSTVIVAVNARLLSLER